MFELETIKVGLGFTAATGGTLVAAAFGQWHFALTFLCFMIVADFVTGLMKGIANKELSSKIGYKGLMRKAGILLVVIIANLLDVLVANDAPLFRTMAIYFYIAIEGLSLLENLESIGVPLPKKLKEFFVQMESETDQDLREEKNELK